MTMAEATPSIQQKPYFEEGTEAMIALELWSITQTCAMLCGTGTNLLGQSGTRRD